MALARPAPLLFPATAFMAGIVASDWVGPGPAWLCLGVAGAAVGTLLVFSRVAPRITRRAPVPLLLLLGASFGAGLLRHQLSARLPPQHVAHAAGAEPELVRLSGRVVSEPVIRTPPRRNAFGPFAPEPRTVFVLSCGAFHTENEAQLASGLVRVQVSGVAGVQVGERIITSGWLSSVPPRRNPGEADWPRIFGLQGIHAMLRVELPEHVAAFGDETPGVLDTLRGWRARLRSLLFEPFAAQPDADEKSVLDAMVLGQRAALSPAVEDAFLRTGAVHYLVVSGFQVVVILAFVTAVLVAAARLLEGLPGMPRWHGALRRRFVAVAGALAVVAYLAFVDWDSSVLRAVTMALVGCAALLLGRALCALNWLSLSALILLVADPRQLFRPGFQLSFVCVLGLCTAWPTLLSAARLHGALWPSGALPALAASVGREVPSLPRQGLTWLASLVLLTFASSLLCWAVAAPIVAFHFGQFHPYAALNCTILAGPVTLATWLGFVAVFGGALAPPLGALSGMMLGGVSGVMLAAVARLAALPGSVVNFAPPPLWLVLVTYAAMAWGMHRLRRWSRRVEIQVLAWQEGRPHTYELERRRLLRRGLLVLAPCGLLLAGWTVWLSARGRDVSPSVHVLSVGNGNAVLAASGGVGFLVDVGTIADYDAGRTVVTAAAHLGVRRLGWAAISHANYDHYSGLPTAAEALGPERLLSTREFFEAAKAQPGLARLLSRFGSDARRALQQGDAFRAGDWEVDVLWPRADLGDGWSPNDTSLVLLLRARERRVLLTGDVEGRALRALLADHADERIDLRCDVLLAPHHGDIEGEETRALLRAAQPRHVLVSSGSDRPRFSSLVAETLGAEVPVLITGKNGAIEVRVRGAGQLDVTPLARGPE